MSQYIQLARIGPFPEQIDPWVEQGQYFHQLHGQFIGSLVQLLSESLLVRGYYLGRETSLQIAEKRQPDIFVEAVPKKSETSSNYSQSAATLALDLGLELVEENSELDALYIRQIESNQLVTVIEIVSPSNKVDIDEIRAYQTRRKRLLKNAVNVIEIDFTRSIKRLIDDKLSHQFPYHIAIHLHDEVARFLGMHLSDKPRVFALPLRGEALAVDLYPAYRQAYELLTLALQIQNQQAYKLEHLPFPSLISNEDNAMLLAMVQAWQAALDSA